MFGKNASQALGIDWEREERTAREIRHLGYLRSRGILPYFPCILSYHEKWAVNKSFEYLQRGLSRLDSGGEI